MSDLLIGAKPIRQPDERGLAEALRITATIFALATPFFVYMGLSASLVQEEYRLSRLVESRHQLSKEHERLVLSRDALVSPGTVNAIALEKLGMVEEDAQEWTVGVEPEKMDGGTGRGGDGGRKAPGQAPEGGRAGGGQKEKRDLSGASVAPPVAMKAPPKDSALGHVTDAVARPKAKGGPKTKPSSARITAKAAPVKHRQAKPKAKRSKTP